VPGPWSGTATIDSDALSEPATTALVAFASRLETRTGAVVVVEATDPLFAGEVATRDLTGTVVGVVIVVDVVGDVEVVVATRRVEVVVDASGRALLAFDPSVKTRTSNRTGLDHISTCVALRGVRRDMVTEE
jgi:hypothetical protein